MTEPNQTLFDQPENHPAVAQEVMIEQGTALLLSVPDTEPDDVLSALAGVFKKHKTVRRAFRVMAREKAHPDDDAVLLIALELSPADNPEAVIQPAADAAMDHLAEGEHIDFCLLSADENDGLTHFLTQHTQAFYQRRAGGFLRDAIPVNTQF